MITQCGVMACYLYIENLNTDNPAFRADDGEPKKEIACTVQGCSEQLVIRVRYCFVVVVTIELTHVDMETHTNFNMKLFRTQHISCHLICFIWYLCNSK